MSFGNKSGYASLSDAYGITEFTSSVENTYTIESPITTSDIPVGVEKFEADDSHVTCDTVKKHCESCSCMKKHKYGHVGNYLNELLNFILILILLWVLVFSPSSSSL
jgi:hypothetical protein